MIDITLSKKEALVLKTKHKYCDENIKIELESESYDNLKSENIADGVTILGVVGTGFNTKNSVFENLLTTTFGSEV